jgi:metal-responsive CopG/Arc/MetJ family transcriptional regulator
LADLNIGCICDAFVRYPVLMVKITKAVRINERHIEELEKLAKKEGEMVSFLIQQAIREYLERKAAK